MKENLPKQSDKPVLILFPQWQGSGTNNEVQLGAETLSGYFDPIDQVVIPLSSTQLDSEHAIAGYRPLLTQLQTARVILNYRKPDKLVLLAGDCAAEIAPIEYLLSRYEGNLTVVWLDAHGDLNTPESSPSGHFHGMPLRLLVDGSFSQTELYIKDRLDHKQLVMAGQRDLDPAESAFIAENAIAVLKEPLTWKQELLALLERRSPEHVYIHLDLDVIDPVLFPHVKCPSEGGFTVEAVAEFIETAVTLYDVVGLSLTETTAETQGHLKPIERILRAYRKHLSV